MLLASKYVEIVSESRGYYISRIEETAWRRGFTDAAQPEMLGEEQKQPAYGRYIPELANDAIKESQS